jgi:hypothetical protein
MNRRLGALVAGLALTFVGCGAAESSTSSPAPHKPALDEGALADTVMRFAVAPGPETIAEVPFASEVSLGLADRLIARQSVEDLVHARAWVIDPGPAGFRGRTGPFSALDLLAGAGQTVVSVDSYPACANPGLDLPPVAALADLTRVSIRPDPNAISTCILWWSVDLYRTAAGDVTAVTLDLWDP